MSRRTTYAEPQLVTDVRECCFYHTMDVPGHGLVRGQWDLRPGIERYLGNVALAGKRVLDVGAASGFLTFHMERQGAEVVSYDLAPEDGWDIVPFAGVDSTAYAAERREIIRKLNNAYWLCHRAFASRARMVHGTIYDIPLEIGPVDIATCGGILLHLRDPFLALQSVLRLTTDTVIVTDLMPRRQLLLYWLGRHRKPRMTFLPDGRTGEPRDAWWMLSSGIVRRFIQVLGFEVTSTSCHWQLHEGRKRLLFTVVGRRTKDGPRGT
jgi:SAM-dependent methyltransferase